MARSTEVAVLDEAAIAKAVDEMGDIERLAEACSLEHLADKTQVEQTVRMAKAVVGMRKLLTDKIMDEYVMPLMNTPLGFLTDKDPSRPVKNRDGSYTAPKPYSRDQVREVVVEGLLKGARLVGNEINVISSRFYGTKEFYQRKASELDVTDIKPAPGRVQMAPDGRSAVIRFGLSWKRQGKREQLVDGQGNPGVVFDVRVNAFMGADAVVGKATRKAFKMMYEQLTGSRLSEPEDDVSLADHGHDTKHLAAADTKSSMEKLTDSLHARQAESKPSELSQEEVDDLLVGAQAAGLDEQSIVEELQREFGVRDIRDLTKEQAKKLRGILDAAIEGAGDGG